MRRLHQHLLILVTFSLFLFGFTAYVTLSGSREGVSREDPFPGRGAWAEARMRGMTLDEKVSQLFVTASTGEFMNVEDSRYRQLVDLVERFGIGGIVVFHSDPLSQVALVNDLQRRSALPLLISQDMEWSAGMRVAHATTFPRMMAIWASRDPGLAYALGAATASEARALGVHQVYAPVADVNSNPRNPVNNVRSYGEDPALVADMVTQHVHGLQDNGVIATAKHFPGHGDTRVDSHLDLPVLPFARARLESVELVPFRTAIDRGVMSIMTGHLALPTLQSDSLLPASHSAEISTALLRDELGFRGLVVTDAMNMRGVTAAYGAGESAVRALAAGADLILMSTDAYAAREAVLRALEDGRLPESRIDEAVERVLRAKEWLGLHEHRLVDSEATRTQVHAPAHQMLAEEIARSGLTLLLNESSLVPIVEPPERMLLITLSTDTMASADSYFAEQLQDMLPTTRLATSFLDTRSEKGAFDTVAGAAADYDLVVLASFVRAARSRGQTSFSPLQHAFVNRLIAQDVPVVTVSFGDPYLIGEMDPPAVYLATYSASEASQKAAAQALSGRSAVGGKLPITIPGRYRYGAGLTTKQEVQRRGFAEEIGMFGRRLRAIDSLLHAAIEKRAFPAASVAVGRAGVIPYLRGFGHFTYESDELVSARTVFDIASLTKVVATTTAIMILYERGAIDLDAPVARYLPGFGAGGKGNVTVKQLLAHTGGLPGYVPFHTLGLTTRKAVIDSILAQPLAYAPGTEYRYTDQGFIVLALVVETVADSSFEEFVREEILVPLDMHRTAFRPARAAPESQVVPTERDRIFRRRLLQGEVHDEAAWILGGVAGNAGLFSTAEDLSRFAFMLVNGGRFDGRQFLKPETIRLFTARVYARPKNTRALGWDTRSEEGYSSAGTLFGARSFGHTGYTGSSLWIDPDEQLYVILLTNRVYPSRENSKHAAVRSELADIAFSAIAGPPAPLLPGPRGPGR